MDHVWELPGLAISTVLHFLPAAHAVMLVHSANAELLELALRRQWRQVAVGDTEELFCRENEFRYSHWVTFAEFSRMVKGGIAPPYRIHCLYYCAMEHGDDPLYMSAEWRQYVTDHCLEMTLDARVDSEDALAWTQAAPHFRSLPISGLWLSLLSEGAWAQPMISESTLPHALRLLRLELRYSTVSVADLVVPQSVRHLSVSVFDTIHPTLLPALPPRLQTIEFSAPSGLDMSEFADVFPHTLTVFKTLPQMAPIVISSGAVQRFSPTLEHDMVVYTGDWPGALEGLTIGSIEPSEINNPGDIEGFSFDKQEGLRLDLSVSANYSDIALPSTPLLRVFCSGGPENARVDLANVSHWLSRVKKLRLSLLLPIAGVVFPPEVEVEVSVAGCDVPPEVWAIPRVTVLGVFSVAQVDTLARLGQMEHLKKLHLTLNPSTAREDFPVLSLLEVLSLHLEEGAACPDIRQCQRLECFMVRCGSLGCLLRPEHLPPSLVMLMLIGHEPMWGDIDPEMYSWQSVRFGHLERLININFWSFRRLALGKFGFPENLVSIQCGFCQQLDLEGVAFPPRLQDVEFNGCGTTDPWTTGSWLMPRWVPRWMPQWLQRGRVKYPDSLANLLICLARGMVAPPLDFCFPPNLTGLQLAHCGITDITLFRLPASLRMLDMRWNNFHIAEDYEWPRLQVMCINRLVADGSVMQIDHDERELLRRKIPGVVIQEW